MPYTLLLFRVRMDTYIQRTNSGAVGAVFVQTVVC
jgi:hypothetical protein